MTLGDWIDQALDIERRRPSAARCKARDRHLASFPIDEIGVEIDLRLIQRIVSLLEGRPHSIFARPPRGARAAAPHTPIIMTLRNRDARLRALGLGGNQAPDER
jgi:hypothetical protein